MADLTAETIQEKAYRLLKAIRARTETTHQPVFLAEIAPELNMDEGEAQGAFRYLADKRWIDTFNLPYTGRINAAGHDVLAARESEPQTTDQDRRAFNQTSGGVDREAESAIREAIEGLIASGKRAYSLSVPLASELALVRRGRGRLAQRAAGERVLQSIIDMVKRDELEAYREGHRDWVLHDPPAESELDPASEARHDTATEWDVFISHASEDKESFVRALAKRLQERGLRVWFDEFTLTVGDSLRRSIDRGLARSRYGIVVISPDFLKKEWPQKELDGLVAREIDGVKVILPVWHNISAGEIRAYSPTLADRLAVSSTKGLVHVTEQLLEAIERQQLTADRAQVSPANTGRPDPAIVDQFQELRDYAAQLHGRRVAEILVGTAPVAMLDGALIVMHVVPLAAVGNRPANSFEALARDPNSFPPIRDNYARDHRINYDGLVTGSNGEGLSRPQRAYVSVSRSAVVEAVESSIARGREHNLIELPHIEAIIIKYACLYAQSLGKHGVAAPMVICVSLVNVQGMKLLQDFIGSAFVPEDVPSGDLDRNQLTFGQALFAAVPQNYSDCGRLLRPILTHLANAAGLHPSPNFDEQGNYVLTAKL